MSDSVTLSKRITLDPAFCVDEKLPMSVAPGIVPPVTLSRIQPPTLAAMYTLGLLDKDPATLEKVPDPKPVKPSVSK